MLLKYKLLLFHFLWLVHTQAWKQPPGATAGGHGGSPSFLGPCNSLVLGTS